MILLQLLTWTMFILAIVLVVLKLVGVIAISWWLVVAPYLVNVVINLGVRMRVRYLRMAGTHAFVKRVQQLQQEDSPVSAELERIREFSVDRDLTDAQAKALDEASKRLPAEVEARELPPRDEK